jgi:hypothetical protein
MNHRVYRFKSLLLHRFPSRIVVFLTLLSFIAPLPSTSCQTKRLKVLERFHSSGQHFYCTTEYIMSECTWQLSVLRHLLDQYNAGDLGEWSWVLVSRAEWKPLLTDLGMEPLSPSITSFVDRETLFDESLFSCDAERKGELLRAFQVPLRQLLTIAITHELGHAFCRDVNEAHAEGFAEDLRNGLAPRCNPSQTYAGEHR